MSVKKQKPNLIDKPAFSMVAARKLPLLGVFVLALAGLLVLAGCELPAASGRNMFLLPSATPEAGTLTAEKTGQPATLPVPQDPIATEIAATPPPSGQPAVTATPLSTCTGASTLEDKSFKSQIIYRDFFFKVYLPPCYDPAYRYPVLILLHGQGSDNTQWLDLGAPATADRLIRNGQVTPFIMIFPLEQSTWSEPQDSYFDDIVEQELGPWIDNNLPVCGTRRCWAIGGISRGASWALKIGLERWKRYGTIGAHSVPAFDDMINNFYEYIRYIPHDQLPRIGIDIGDQDPFVGLARIFTSVLDRYNVPYEFTLGTGKHDRDYWAGNTETYLAWYAAVWAR